MIKQSLRFDLRTLGVLLFCLSVGLTANVSRWPDSLGLLGLLEILPGLLYEVLLITGATAIAFDFWLFARIRG